MSEKKKVSLKKKPVDKNQESKDDTLKEKLRKRRNKKSFEEKHVRVTTYLEKAVREKLELLKDKGMIESYTQIINQSVKYFIAEHIE
jgi:hypothetical protein